MRQQSYTISPARVEVVDTPTGKIPIPHKSVRVKFKPMPQPFHTPLLAAKNGYAWGTLDTETAAAALGVEEKVITEFLMAHPDYGVRMVGIGVDGQEVISEEAYIVNEGEKGFYCKLCERHLSNIQGMRNHTLSNVHKEKMEIAKYEAIAQVQLS
jgi:hypothetical protein